MRNSLALLLLLVAPIAAKGDGIPEINQTCAVRTGCFPGDGAGFPVTITTPGSFVLTGSLTVPDLSTTAILVSASDVTVDLAGFRIQGLNSCSGTPTVCSSLQPGVGVAVDDSSLRFRVEVRNGTIVGMGSDGVNVGDDCVVRNLRLAENGGNGVDGGSEGCLLEGNISSENGNYGLQCNQCTVIRNVTMRNGTRGISADGTIFANTSRENGTFGILSGVGSTIADNTVTLNVSDGIVVNGRSIVGRNTVRSNGGAGIRANSGDGLLVQGNAIGGNTGFGMSLGAEDAYTENSIVGNTAGTVAGGVPIGANFCDGAAAPACP